MTFNKEVQEILDEAKALREQKQCNYNDYETFKRRLYDIGAYGYERALADALGV